MIRVSKEMPAEVELNQTFDYIITVANVTDCDVSQICLSETLPDGLRFVEAYPTAEVEGNKLKWHMDLLSAGQCETITVTATAITEDCLKTCATLDCEIPACAMTNVVIPGLQVTQATPECVTLCDCIPIEITVSNPGSGSAKNVNVVTDLPAGLVTDSGMCQLNFDLDCLAPGECRTFNANLKAERTGTFTPMSVATAQSGLRDDASSSTGVTQAVLRITASSPMQRYLGKSITYNFTVSNIGNTAAMNTTLVANAPAGSQNLSVSDGGCVDCDTITWNLGTLDCGESREVCMSIQPACPGDYEAIATANAICAECVTDDAATNIVGIPAILLEVVDCADPIEIGCDTTYSITATNQGTMAGTNIRIAAKLEPNVEFVSANGPTMGTYNNGTLVFDGLGSLDCGQSATWTVTVRATASADSRFQVVMTSDQLTKPVMETEATQLYQ